MRHFQLLDTQSQKLQQFLGVEAEAAAEVAVDEDVEEVHQVKILKQVQSTEVPSTQTFPRESGEGVKCIIDGVAELFSAVNLQPVRGRIFLLKSQPNETGTSP